MLYDSLHDIVFAQPYQFILLGLVPLFIYIYLNNYQQRQAALVVSTTSTFPGVPTWKTALRHLPFIFRMIAFVFLVIALARPQVRNEEHNVTGEGVDIILTIDVSGSMTAQDFSPNRMEAAKEVATNFVDSRPTDRIGLVIFSGESFTLSPATTDKAVLKTQISNIHNGLLEDGTAIGSGLATSVDRLRSSKAKSKVVILLTDGMNNGGMIDPNTAKEIAKAEGVKVYTIGMGTDGYAPVPEQLPGGGTIMQREKVDIDEKLLTQIADETGGRYFRAKDNESLRNIYNEIDKLEKSKIETTTVANYTEKFLPFVIIAGICILLEILLRLTLLKKFP